MDNLTPASISTTSFKDKTDEYQKISASISDTEAEVAKAEFALKEFLSVNGFSNLVESGKITDVRDKLKVIKPEEIDEQRTAELQKGYSEKLTLLVNAKIDLEKLRSKLGDVKNYIVFLKEIAQLAPKPEGKKGGSPQGQQQN